MIKKRGGFTLVESLIGILIMAVVLLMIINIPQSTVQSNIEMTIFLERLSAQIKKAQQDAIVKQISERIDFNARDRSVDFSDERLFLPDGWGLRKFDQVFYYANGRANKFLTIYFWYQDEYFITLAFQLGSGQFEIKK